MILTQFLQERAVYLSFILYTMDRRDIVKGSQLKILISLIFLFVAGFSTGYFLREKPIEMEREGIILNEVEYARLKKAEDQNLEFSKKIQELSNINIEEYVTLKEQEEKYLKADELLGKVMLIFLADLGLHLDLKKKIRNWAESSEEERIKKLKSTSPLRQPETTPVAQNTPPIPYEEVSSFVEAKDFEFDRKMYGGKALRGFLGFEDRLDRNVRRHMDNDIQRQLWGNKPYRGKTNPLTYEQLKNYEGERKGYFRTGGKTEARVNYNLKINRSKSKKDKMTVTFGIHIHESKNIIVQINEIVKAVHPDSHNRGGTGSCRGVILRGSNGINIYLSFLNQNSKQIVGRVLGTELKRPFYGNFLLE